MGKLSESEKNEGYSKVVDGVFANVIQETKEDIIIILDKNPKTKSIVERKVEEILKNRKQKKGS